MPGNRRTIAAIDRRTSPSETVIVIVIVVCVVLLALTGVTATTAVGCVVGAGLGAVEVVRRLRGTR